MELDLLELYGAASAWTNEKVRGAVGHLDAPTPCDEWDVRALLNHMLDAERYFVGAARGEDTARPAPTPPDLLSDDPVADFERAREELLRVYTLPGVMEKSGFGLGIAFCDQLLHGWDLARATGQDAVMPPGLADAAYATINGRLTPSQRGRAFKPEFPVPADAGVEARLLAYTGRRA